MENEKSKERSSAYPSCGLEDAIRSVERVRKELGKGPYDRESLAKALGYSGVTGTSGRFIGALVQYGLLSRSGSSYSESELTRKIIDFLSEDERKKSIANAAVTPKIFAAIYERYKGQELPSMLSHIVVREYGIISQEQGKFVAKTFREALVFAGLILENRIVTFDSPVTESEQGHQLKPVKSPEESNHLLEKFKSDSDEKNKIIKVDLNYGYYFGYRPDRAADLIEGLISTEFTALREKIKSVYQKKSDNNGTDLSVD